MRATIASMVRLMDALLLGRCLHLLSLNNNAPSSFSISRLMGPTIPCSAHLLLRRWRRLAARSWQVQRLARRPPQCRQWGRPWERARALPRSVAAPSLLPRHATPRKNKKYAEPCRPRCYGWAVLTAPRFLSPSSPAFIGCGGCWCGPDGLPDKEGRGGLSHPSSLARSTGSFSCCALAQPLALPSMLLPPLLSVSTGHHIQGKEEVLRPGRGPHRLLRQGGGGS